MAPISRSLLLVMIAVYLVTVVASAFKLLKINHKHAERTSKLETKILETQLKLKEQELNYLKMQIHPHFLFNTLNTMYGFALKKADETPEIILKLSNLLDYLLYQINKPHVQLRDEINHIKDYIELEQIRFHDTLKCSFKTELENEALEIAPMLFIPFVENSFKHGVIKNGFLNLDIAIINIGKTIHFNIKNTNTKQGSVSHGIGLENITKRLELLYKDQYTLNIKNEDNVFEVDLSINTETK
jgi:LytS/YehU family sensor histidine kinase